MEGAQYEDCKCVRDLNYSERELEIQRIVSEKFTLKSNTTGVLIFSHLEFATIGINSIPFQIRKGTNRICYCEARDFHFQVDLVLTSYLLATLSPVPCKLKNTESFILHPLKHNHTCQNSTVPSLFLSTYFSLYAQGLLNSDLREITEKGYLPIEIYKKHPKSFVYRAYLEIGDLVHMPSRAFYMSYIVACKDPANHMYKYLD
jgi:hypothetical protein